MQASYHRRTSKFVPMPLGSTLLSDSPVMNSRDPEFVRDRLFGVYGVNNFEIGSGKDKFAVRANLPCRSAASDCPIAITPATSRSEFSERVHSYDRSSTFKGSGRYSIDGGPTGGDCAGILEHLSLPARKQG